MGDPICKWRAARPHNVVELVNMLPHHSMSNEEFREIMEKAMPGFFHTPYQLACQLALYYVDNGGMYHPRFAHDITEDDAIIYLEKFVSLYYVPNPYTPRGFSNLDTPIYLERSLVEYLENHNGIADLDQALRDIIKEDVGNLSATKTFLSYSKLLTFDGYSVSLAPNYKQLMEAPFKRSDKSAFFDIFESQKKNSKIKEPLQIIWYGAPGTGKSFDVNEKTRGHSVIRTTFHPDSDYSTFVGAYKPIMEEQEARVLPVVLGTGASFDTNNGTYKEKRIVYKFVKQAFLKAYLGAWQKYAKGGDEIEPQFLVIEEINRGNCAQIFGDLFQLLDRENGFSKYPIEADDDIRREIDFAFNDEKAENGDLGEYRLPAGLDIDAIIPEYESAYGASLSEDVKKGRVLLLPPNLYIWATMNTSDQSLFPIDSAFKRRWEWKYIKISEGFKKENGVFVKDASGNRIRLGWEISGPNYSLDWWEFVKAINAHISEATSSDDKKLGYFFCKPANGNSIDEETFAGKVLFYLWNDVFKDNDNRIFIVEDGQKEASFDVFYTEDGDSGLSRPNSANILKFLKNVMGENGKSKIRMTETVEPNTETTENPSTTSEDSDTEAE